MSFRHAFAAHKLITNEEGEVIFLSKENDSNGCIGTVDVSYPSVPLFLRYNPELVFAMCRPVLEFAHMPVWTEDFAPHDVGRYPYVSGQVYGAKRFSPTQGFIGAAVPPYYLYPAGAQLYEDRYQMPVEECGNMLIMLYAAAKASGDTTLLQEEKTLLGKWVHYLDQYGENPGNQLCTDDFAGHLAQNVNLSAKAIVGVMCYARILELLGEDAAAWTARAKEMAAHWLENHLSLHPHPLQK